MFAGITVTIVHKPEVTGKDKGNRPIYSTREEASQGWAIWPSRDSVEDNRAGDVLTDVYTAVAPVGVAVDAIDQVKALGRTFQVTGTPFAWASPFTGHRAGTQLTLKAVH